MVWSQSSCRRHILLLVILNHARLSLCLSYEDLFPFSPFLLIERRGYCVYVIYLLFSYTALQLNYKAINLQKDTERERGRVSDVRYDELVHGKHTLHAMYVTRATICFKSNVTRKNKRKISC